jgi:hypothetical protein
MDRWSFLTYSLWKSLLLSDKSALTNLRKETSASGTSDLFLPAVLKKIV